MKGFYRVSFDFHVYCGFTDEFIRIKESVDGKTALSMDRLWAIYSCVKYGLGKPGVFMECGVDRGGSAKFIHDLIKDSGRDLHLFDTFSGMPESSEIDFHKKGDFPGFGVGPVKDLVGGGIFHEGKIPDTFKDCPEIETIAFAHVDCDLLESTYECCRFIYPRLSGVMVFDDYGRHTTEGVRVAVDEYFKDKDCLTLPNLSTCQMVVVK